MVFQIELIKKLKMYRELTGITQKQMAELLHISRSYYSDIENGRYLPSGKVISKMNDILFFLK